MEREQIIKDIELCIDRPNCTECPNFHLCNGNGFEYQLVNALSLIKELTEDVERVAKQCGEIIVECDERDAERLKQVAKLTEENERLRAENENKCKDCAGCISDKCDCANIEAYTVEKYKSAIIEYYSKPKYQPTKEHPIKHTQIEYLFAVLDQIAKEMLEDKNL